MELMDFQVSAKTARLIGRENISGVDGAIIELVKNGYDADAECVCIKYIIPFNEVPKTLNYSEVKDYFEGNTELLLQNYSVKDGQYVLNEIDVNYSELDRYLRSISKIVVIDNGVGMNKDILKNAWMNIGTDNKEVNTRSKKRDRVKTGAKGIGRFALDKLSLCTQVFTKCEEEQMYQWKIDWTQFDRVKLLNQVKANLLECEGEFIDLVKMYLQEDFDLVKNYQWDTGTIIVLNPIREFWDEKLYIKVNNNLRNINPFGSVDHFDVFVCNYNHPDLNYQTENTGISRENYDYSIDAEFDGQGHVTLTLDRNEINVSKNSIRIEYSPTDVEEYDLNEFWNREAFKIEKYKRADFDGTSTFHYSIEQILENPSESLERYNAVGPFSLKMYYIKNQKSTVEIVKDFKSRKRKQILNTYSGIKLYRDDFKVRPYGDEGQFFDWINMSLRVQKSPAAASHESGNWRVSPNQLIGSVSISRMNNPKLEDTANREGMSLNREYECFIEIIHGILSKFEYDRQYALREFAAWDRAKRKIHVDKAQQVYEQVMREREKISALKESGATAIVDDNLDTDNTISDEDLKDAILTLGKKNENRTSTEQLMMVLSAAGVMAQTFSHEITRMGTEFGSRGQHLREAINRLLNYQPYMGDEDFNPYDLLDELDSTDELLSEWVSLIMDSVKQDNFESRFVDLKEFLLHIAELWSPLLQKKYINIETTQFDDDIRLSLPTIDLHLILNNFILNSAYYLEEAEGERFISFSIYEEDNKVHLEMSNNGPKLDEKYAQNPDVTLNARETTKEGGTGLGLWIAREATMRNAGQLHVIPVEKGYMLRATWIK